jgi:hypothetical protein
MRAAVTDPDSHGDVDGGCGSEAGGVEHTGSIDAQ